MKKQKRILLTAGIILCAVILVCGFLLRGKSITVGRYLSSNGGDMLIDGSSPIVMSDLSAKQALFDNLQSGDKILVVHNGVNESYPGQTGAYFCMKLEGGNDSDIPREVITSLTELGWLGVSTDLPGNWLSNAFTCPLTQTQTVTCTCDGITMALELPEGWEYSLSEESDSRRGICFWPAGQEGQLGFYCYDGVFAVCGTGLRTDPITLQSGLNCSVGTYDSHKVWDYIAIQGFDHKFAILNEGADAWWDAYEEEAMAIINTISLVEQ